jgi:cell division protein FtsW (lipid II flippase)
MGRDGLAGLVILAGSAVLYWATLSIESNSLVPVSPAFYPRLVIGATAILAALLVAQDFFARRRAPAREPGAATGAAPKYGMVVLLFAIFAGYVFLLPPLGYRVATFAFVVVMQLALEPARTPRRWIVTLVVAVAVTLVTYYVFEHYLQVLLPRGRWTGF